ncbi:MAG: hypothetical protein KF857_12900 [Fimbriimonadaceae bacterium]|nr:hypothetical protein [Fimbriimonadaceae bacterium]
MKQQRGWGHAVLVCVAFVLVGAALGASLGYRDGQNNQDKYDWTYINGEGYPQEVTGAISLGTVGTLAGLALGVVYLVGFGLVRGKRARRAADEVAAEPPATG